jgi:hypothetical protein
LVTFAEVTTNETKSASERDTAPTSADTEASVHRLRRTQSLVSILNSS